MTAPHATPESAGAVRWPVLFDPIELAALELSPLVCNAAAYERLCALCGPSADFTGAGPADAVNVARIMPLRGGRFALEGEVFGDGWRDAAIILCRDEMGAGCDLAALSLETGAVRLWSGMAAGLGFENAYSPRLDGAPLEVHETALDWLRTGRRGVVVVDPQRAAPVLRLAGPLGVRNAAFGARIREALTIASPRILVAAEQGRAAA